VLQETIRQLDAYFHEGLIEFDIPVQLVGTSFQQKVWSALMQIPYGEMESYLGLSKTLGNEKLYVLLLLPMEQMPSLSSSNVIAS